MNAQGMKDYLKLIPGVTFIDQGDDDSIPIIRGVSVSLDSGVTAGTTGIYLDDMPFADLEDNSQGPVAAGTRLPGTPRFQWSNVAAYERSLPYFSDWVGGFSLTHVHLGASPDNIRPEGMLGGYDTLDARLTLTRPGSPFLPEISAAVHNLTDVRGLSYHNNIQGTNFVHFVTRRTTIVSASWRY